MSAGLAEAPLYIGAPGQDFRKMPRSCFNHPIFRNKLEAAIFAWIASTGDPLTGEKVLHPTQDAAEFKFSRGAFLALVGDLLDEGLLLRCDPPSASRAIVVRPNTDYEFGRSYPSLAPRRRAAGRAQVPASIRADVFAASQGVCFYCSSPLARGPGPSQFHVDHKTPLARGGSSLPANLVASCRSCNLAKGARPIRVFSATRRAGAHNA